MSGGTAMSLIAVVEDEPSISEVVFLYLKRSGYQVQLYADGLAAQEAFSHQIPDLVILDIMLPGWMALRSPAACATLRRCPSSCSLPAARRATASPGWN